MIQSLMELLENYATWWEENTEVYREDVNRPQDTRGIGRHPCLCCCGIFFLTLTNIEPTAAVAQNTAAGRSIIVEELIVTAESTNTAATVEVSSHSPNPANMSRPSNTVGLTEIPQPTAILQFFLVPTQDWFSSEHIESVVY